MKLGKKALASGIIVILALMFFSAFTSLFSLVMWNQFNQAIQNAPNETIQPDVKQKVDELGAKMLWADKIFILLFTVLLVSFIISSVTLPVERPIYLLIFYVILVIVTIVAMGLSNSWAYVMQHPDVATAAQDMPAINNFMRFMPFIVFFIGIIGSVLFYARKERNFGTQGPGDAFE